MAARTDMSLHNDPQGRERGRGRGESGNGLNGLKPQSPPQVAILFQQGKLFYSSQKKLYQQNFGPNLQIPRLCELLSLKHIQLPGSHVLDQIIMQNVLQLQKSKWSFTVPTQFNSLKLF